MDATEASRLAVMLLDDFKENRFDLTTREVEIGDPAPGVAEVECMRASGVSDQTVRLFTTFIMAMNYMRNAARLWQAGHQLYCSSPELFEPEHVTSLPCDSLRQQLSSFNVNQRRNRDTRAWRRIAYSLSQGSGPVRNLIDHGDGSAQELLRDLRSSSAGRKRFPHLAGQKLAPMWIRVVAEFGRARITGIDTILPVAVDVHVRRATENMGVTETRNKPLESATPVIQDAWRNAAAAARATGANVTSSALDPVLWFFGAYGCSHCERVGQRFPISSGRACSSCQLPVQDEHG